MLSNFDLEHIAQHYNFPLTVLMKDELKNHKPKSSKSSSQGNGTHWLSLFIRNKQCFYMDLSVLYLPNKLLISVKGYLIVD